MFEIGNICVKLAGRDSGQYCVIVEKLDDRYVVIDGNTRRRKCNVAHLEPIGDKVEIKQKASYQDVVAALESQKIPVVKRGEKREAKPRQKKQKAIKQKSQPEDPVKKAAKKATKKPEDKQASKTTKKEAKTADKTAEKATTKTTAKKAEEKL